MSENNYSYEPEVTPVVSGGAKAMGIISMVLGIVSITNGLTWGAGIVMAIVGLVLSTKARNRGELRFSKAGRITSIIGLVGGIVGLILMFVLTATGFFTGVLSELLEELFEETDYIFALCL